MRRSTTHLRRCLPAVLAGVLLLGACSDADTEASDPAPASTTAATDVTTLGAPADQDARCMAPSAATLASADIAFAGTVTEVADGTVVLETTEWFTGAQTDTVEVTAPPAALDGLIQSVDFKNGQDYLVAAKGGSVMICGFSGPAAPALRSLYDDAFGQ